MVRTRLMQLLRPHIREQPVLRRMLVSADETVKLLKHTTAAVLPTVIRPAPERLTVAITSRCNLRCVGCRYGRDFMPNAQLSPNTVYGLLSDAATLGFPTARLYGGEPLLHPQLANFIEHAIKVGIKPVITTNAMLLDKQMPRLYGAGLRALSIGYYGVSEEYDSYTGRKGAYSQLERSIATVRNVYGMSVDLQINFLLTRHSCSADLLRRAWTFAKNYRLSFQLDLVHYSLPYFTEGRDRELQFTCDDRDRLLAVTHQLLGMKSEQPQLFVEPIASIKSIPDWALKQADMEVPCDAYKMLWIGADGTVQLCYAAFPLGNLHQTRLGEIFGSPGHKRSCRSAFRLECPRCHCERGSRIQSHLPSRVTYSRALQPPARLPEPSSLPLRILQ
jgi:MoaA/NifB/PqqE/SkfB family radical SAM enzyme